MQSNMFNPNLNQYNNQMKTEHRLIKALLRQPVDKTPVWIMRQAGRYLPEYRALRTRAQDFLVLCKTPELACEVTLQPLARFPLDAAIIFSDILTIPDAYGLGLKFVENEGPIFTKPIQTKADILQLPSLDPEVELRYVMDAIRMTKSELQGKAPLIGFAGSPWTIATYMIEGKSSKNFSKIKSWVYRDPESLHLLLNHLAKTTTDYLNAQIQAGADVVMLFDTWGGVLTRSEYLAFSLHYMSQIVSGIRNANHNHQVPIILFTKNGGQHLVDISCAGSDAIGLDWTADLRLAKQQVGHKVALQGNLDPAVLYADAKRIQFEVEKVLQQFGPGTGHVFNLGHGIHPDMDPEKVAGMIETVHNYSQSFHFHFH
jgi:uroporphyrinogen decarboxylase